MRTTVFEKGVLGIYNDFTVIILANESYGNFKRLIFPILQPGESIVCVIKWWVKHLANELKLYLFEESIQLYPITLFIYVAFVYLRTLC